MAYVRNIAAGLQSLVPRCVRWKTDVSITRHCCNTQELERESKCIENDARTKSYQVVVASDVAGAGSAGGGIRRDCKGYVDTGGKNNYCGASRINKKHKARAR